GEVAEAARVLRSALDLARETGDLQTGREMETFLRRAERNLGGTREDHHAPPAEQTQHAETPEAKPLSRRVFEHFANDRHDEAIALYEQALKIDPELAIAWNGLSRAHRQKGDLEAAIEPGRRLIELEPDDALSHTNLSILYQRRGMIPEAEEEKAIAMRTQRKSRAARANRCGVEVSMAEIKSLGLSPELHAYLVAHGPPADPVLDSLARETQALGPISIMQVAPEQGALLTMLARLTGARRGG